MQQLNNAALIMLATSANSFQMPISLQNRPSSKLNFWLIPDNEIDLSNEDGEQTPNVGQYRSNQDNSIHDFPKIGKEFKQLLGEDFYKAMYMAYSSGDDYFLQDAIPPGQVDEVILCSAEDYLISGHSGNCYNFAIGTECGVDGNYEEQFPRGELPALGFEKKEDNCDSVKHDLLLEPGMRLKSPDEECEADEREIISYYSPVNQDIHFVAATPKTALEQGEEKQYLHKSSGQPARTISEETINSGKIPENSAIYIIKDSREDFDIYDKQNSPRMRFSNEETAPYEECHRFCYKIQQERQSVQNQSIAK